MAMSLCDTFRTWAMWKTSGECVTLAAHWFWCNNPTALVLTRSGYLLAVAGASTTSIPHKGRYIFGGRTFSSQLQKRRRLNRFMRFCFHFVDGGWVLQSIANITTPTPSGNFPYFFCICISRCFFEFMSMPKVLTLFFQMGAFLEKQGI